MEEIQIDDVQKMLDEIMDDHCFSVREALMNISKRGGSCLQKRLYGVFCIVFVFSDIENRKRINTVNFYLCIFIAAVLAVVC